MPPAKTNARSAISGPPRSDLLARAYLEILAKEAGARIKPMLRGDYSDDALERLIDELDEDTDVANITPLRPDLAATAILVARAIEAEPGLARRLRREAPIVVLATHSPHFVEMAKDVAQTCVLPAGSRLMEVGGASVSSQTRAVLVARDGTAKDHQPEKGNRDIAAAVQRRIPLMGIAPDPIRHLPQAMSHSWRTIAASVQRLETGGGSRTHSRPKLPACSLVGDPSSDKVAARQYGKGNRMDETPQPDL